MTVMADRTGARPLLVSTDHPVALVLGSGFHGLSGIIKPVRRVSYEQVDGYVRPADGRVGHADQMTMGTIDGVPVVVYPSRLHLYQGCSAHEVTSLVRHAHACGCRVAICIGASGLVDGTDDQAIGMISDHLNLTGENPLRGWNSGRDPFVPMVDAYDRELRQMAHDVARERGVELREGVYAEVVGPSLETPAEVRALRMLGVSYVGMSLSLEVIMARALGMRVLALTLPTNPAGASWVSHRSIRAEATSATRELGIIVRGVLERLACQK